MKRLTAILFFLIYATTAFGITIDFHYCQGLMVKSSLLNIEAKPDCCCKKDASGTMSKGCCTDDVKVSKAESHNTIQSIGSLDLTEHVALTNFLTYLLHVDQIRRPIAQTTVSKTKQDHKPVYLLCRVFRI